MKIVLMGDPVSNKFVWISFPDGLEYLNEKIVIPQLKKAGYPNPLEEFAGRWELIKRSNQSGLGDASTGTGPLIRSPIGRRGLIKGTNQYNQFGDFGFAWVVFASIVSSIASAYGSSRMGGSGGVGSGVGEGWDRVVQYLVNNKFLYCTDDCGAAWRVWINNAGQAEIASRELTGANVRFDCAILPSVLLNLVPCDKTKERGKQYSGSGGAGGGSAYQDPSDYPTAPMADWMVYALLGGVGLVLVISVMGSRKK